jgi:PAS domain S-box-containing protein
VALTGEPERFEIFVTALDQWFSVAAYSPAKGHFVAVFDVVTERKRAEIERDTARRRLGLVLESATDSIAMVDTDCRYTVFNSAFRSGIERLYGVTIKPGDALLESLGHVPEDLAFVMDCWQRALRGEDFSVTREFGVATRERGWYELRFSPSRDTSGRIVGAVHVVRDITERKQAEDALRASELRFRRLFELLPIGVTLTDASGRITHTNPASEPLLGIPSDELARRDFKGPYWTSSDPMAPRCLPRSMPA